MSTLVNTPASANCPASLPWLVLAGFCVVLATAAYRGVSRRAR